MREIKFRAWLPKIKEMTNVYVIDQTKSSGVEYYETCRSWNKDNQQYKFKYDEAEFMQFTGLLDKNGKEIYEGDILDVKFNTGYVQRIYWKGEPDARAVVFWDFAGFRLKCKGKEDERYADWADTDGYFDPILDMERSESEIIGNIYENPDLLTQKP